MCIAEDFNRYYGRTYVGVRGRGGVIHPFHVSDVRYQQWFVEEAEEADVDLRLHANKLYSQHGEIVTALQFDGQLIDKDGSRIEKSYPMSDLILENPELGYIKTGSGWRWVAYLPRQSVKKGVLAERLTYTSFGRKEMYNMFNIKPEGNLLSRDVLIDANRLKYKGVSIGYIDGNDIHVGYVFRPLENMLQEILPPTYSLSFTEEPN